MAFKNGRCDHCGCQVKEWCHDENGKWIWTTGCERRSAVQRIWSLTSEEAEKVRSGITGNESSRTH